MPQATSCGSYWPGISYLTSFDTIPALCMQAEERPGAPDRSQAGASSSRPSPVSSPTAAAYQRRKSGEEQRYTHWLCISPDAPTNPVLYWLGNMSHNPSRFLLESAKGPLHLDLGDVLYAPNLLVDAQVSNGVLICSFSHQVPWHSCMAAPMACVGAVRSRRYQTFMCSDRGKVEVCPHAGTDGSHCLLKRLLTRQCL